MQTHIISLPGLRRRRSRTQRAKALLAAAIPVAAAKKTVPAVARKAVPDSTKGKAAGALAVAAAAAAGAGYKLRGRGSSAHGGGDRHAANNAGPVTPPATHAV